jgi:hypothetical protein
MCMMVFLFVSSHFYGLQIQTRSFRLNNWVFQIVHWFLLEAEYVKEYEIDIILFTFSYTFIMPEAGNLKACIGDSLNGFIIAGAFNLHANLEQFGLNLFVMACLDLLLYCRSPFSWQGNWSYWWGMCHHKNAGCCQAKKTQLFFKTSWSWKQSQTSCLRRPCCTSRHRTYPLLYTSSISNYKSL